MKNSPPKYNRLTILRTAPVKNQRSRVVCKCECGTVKEYDKRYVVKGKTKSCGCLKKDAMRKVSLKHGSAGLYGTKKTVEYIAWINIRQRCQPHHERREDYYDRGIAVCKRWNDSFEAFLEDMGPKPGRMFTVERRNNSKGYSPDNCYWGTYQEQARNTRRNVCLTLHGVTRCLTEWAEVTGLKRLCIERRIKSGWSAERALTTPRRKQRNLV